MISTTKSGTRKDKQGESHSMGNVASQYGAMPEWSFHSTNCIFAEFNTGYKRKVSEHSALPLNALWMFWAMICLETLSPGIHLHVTFTLTETLLQTNPFMSVVFSAGIWSLLINVCLYSSDKACNAHRNYDSCLFGAKEEWCDTTSHCCLCVGLHRK